MKSFEWVAFSDVHLYHPNTPTHHILERLDEMIFLNDKLMSTIKMILVPGDFWDRDIGLETPECKLIKNWLTARLELCHRLGIHYIQMEGTPSHDYKQGYVIPLLCQSPYIHYIDTLCIKRFDDLDMDIMFIPDEWKPKCEDIRLDVLECLHKHNMTQVDVVSMHGMFGHQLPKGIKLDHHDAHFYSSIARHVVVCGHVHTPSKWKNVYVPGSTDRLRHNEEEEKGYWYFTSTPKKTKGVFQVNENAWIYKTFDVRNMTYEDGIRLVTNGAINMSDGSFIQIRAEKNSPLLNIRDLKQQFPNLNWKTDRKDLQSTELAVETVNLTPNQQPLNALTKDNLIPRLEEFAVDTNRLWTPDMARLTETLLSRLK